MARGLSDIQRKILILAYRNRYHHEDLYYPEIFNLIFHWPKSYGWRAGDQSDWIINDRQNYSRELIGLAQYKSTRISISKSISRLVNRGLVNKITHGITLTENGALIACRLSIKDWELELLANSV